MCDSEQHPGEEESGRPIHWTERLCASAWVRVL
jgi:hypothetical protein